MLGPLSRVSEPHAYDLCREHASRMTPPRGWELLRVAGGTDASDDLVALADAVTREPAPEPPTAPGAGAARPEHARRHPAPGEQSSGRHLHVVRNPHD